MRKAMDYLFEEAVAKIRVVDCFPFLIIGIIALRITAGHLWHQPDATEVVSGVSVDQHIIYQDQTSTRFLHIKVEDSDNEISVPLPQDAMVRIGQPVEINRFYSKSTGQQHFVFLGYSNQRKRQLNT